MTRHQSNQPDEEKPFDFVPIVPFVKSKTVGHETVRGAGFNTGRLTYQIKTLSYLFIAGGSYVLSDDRETPVVRDFYKIGNRPAIPGSSLKGVVRSVTEAISPSCVTVTKIDAKDVPHAAQIDEERCQPGNACPACSMFGRLDRMSKVFFNDAALVKGKLRHYHLPALYSPQIWEAKEVYKARGQYKGRKFYYHGRVQEDERQPPVEALPPGSLLRGELQFENLSDAELGLLIMALGLDTSFTLKLGGGKPVCLGSIQVQPGSLTLRTAADFLHAEPADSTRSGEAMVEVMIEKVRAAYQKRFILSEPLDKLREIWRYPNQRDCPSGAY